LETSDVFRSGVPEGNMKHMKILDFLNSHSELPAMLRN